jgi:hypothetical protein
MLLQDVPSSRRGGWRRRVGASGSFVRFISALTEHELVLIDICGAFLTVIWVSVCVLQAGDVGSACDGARRRVAACRLFALGIFASVVHGPDPVGMYDAFFVVFGVLVCVLLADAAHSTSGGAWRLPFGVCMLIVHRHTPAHMLSVFLTAIRVATCVGVRVLDFAYDGAHQSISARHSLGPFTFGFTLCGLVVRGACFSLPVVVGTVVHVTCVFVPVSCCSGAVPFLCCRCVFVLVRRALILFRVVYRVI